MKNYVLAALLFFSSAKTYSQETLQTVTDRGNSTSNGREIQFNFPDGTGYTFIGGMANYARIGGYGHNGGRDLILNDAGGNVGIGGIANGYKFGVFGTSFFQDRLVAEKNDSNLSWENAAIETRGTNPGIAFHFPGQYGASLWMNTGGDLVWGGRNIVLNGGGKKIQVQNGGLDFAGGGDIASIYYDDSGGNGTGKVRLDLGDDNLSSQQFVIGGTRYDGQINNTASFKANGDSEFYGNVSIGSNNSHGYKLAVADKMIAEEIKVKLQSSWPDYVFEESYHLPSLKETEKFIKTNKHLQGIPSAKEVAQDGLNLADMNAKLLQKLEELTLHIIELNKRIEKLEGL
ncbi:hypothetical protein [Pseudopedobacter beijingensis]|uniref:Chaperone of endosialidase n=1 Tax=Pseudopedobacter beijingensis TaxID=1207056 RepID=A0ABW4II84_9SPHI